MARVRLTVRCVVVNSPPGGAFESGGHPWAGSLIGAVGKDWYALTLADPDDLVGASSGQVVGPTRQGW